MQCLRAWLGVYLDGRHLAAPTREAHKLKAVYNSRIFFKFVKAHYSCLFMFRHVQCGLNLSMHFRFGSAIQSIRSNGEKIEKDYHLHNYCHLIWDCSTSELARSIVNLLIQKVIKCLLPRMKLGIPFQISVACPFFGFHSSRIFSHIMNLIDQYSWSLMFKDTGKYCNIGDGCCLF